MVARSHFGSNLESKVFTMSPEEENYRKKLRRVDSLDISSAVPGSALSISEPASGVFTFTGPVSGVFTFTAANPGGREGVSRRRCRLCNRHKLTKASSTNRKMVTLSADASTGQVNPFGTRNVNFKQSGPSRFLGNSSENDKFTDGVQPQYIPVAGESKFMAYTNLFSTVQPDEQNLPVKKLEDTDQIVQKASEMVKLLESHIAALQLSAQTLNTPSERMTSVQGIPMSSDSNFKANEPVNPSKLTNHNFMGTTSISPRPLANSCRQCRSCLPNFSPAITFPCQTSSPTPSLSYTPSREQSPSITFPCQTPLPTQNLSYAQSQPQSQSPAITWPCHTPSHSVSQSYTPSQPQSPAIPWPCYAPSHSLSQSYTPSHSLSQSYTPSQPQSPAIICPCHAQGPSPTLRNTPSQPQIPVPNQIIKPNPMQRVSSISSQRTDTPSLNVKNIVQRLESLSVSPTHLDKTPIPTPKCIHEFRFPPLRTTGKLEKDNMYLTSKKAGSVASSSSGVNKHFKPSNTAGQTGISGLTRNPRLPVSKLIRSHKLPPRQQHSSDYKDESGISGSSSSWTTTQQSGSSASHPSDAESSRTTESESSTETTSSSASPTNRQRLSISIPHSFTRRRSKKKPSVPNENPISRLRKIKNKLGLIFHHHHHHHGEDSKPSRTKLPVVRQTHETAAVKRVDQSGHFRALLGGLMRHIRSNKKKKKSKPLKEIRQLKKKVQLGKAGKRARGLKLPKINKKSKFKAVRK